MAWLEDYGQKQKLCLAAGIGRAQAAGPAGWNRIGFTMVLKQHLMLAVSLYTLVLSCSGTCSTHGLLFRDQDQQTRSYLT